MTIEKLLKTRWYVVLAFAGGFMVYGAIFMTPHFDRAALALAGLALVFFGAARSECMKRLEISYPGAKLVSERHAMTRTGAALYAIAAAAILMAAARAGYVWIFL